MKILCLEHLLGTARMGRDPEHSVVNEWGRSHDVKNLLIVDGSILVTCGGANRHRPSRRWRSTSPTASRSGSPPCSTDRIRIELDVVEVQGYAPLLALSGPQSRALIPALQTTVTLPSPRPSEGRCREALRRRDGVRRPADLHARRHSGGVGAPPGATRSPCQELADVSRRKSIRSSS